MKRFIGIDLSKRSMEVSFLEEGKFSLKKLSTSPQGRAKLMKLLDQEDTIALETGNMSFLLAKMIQDEVKAKVHVLNAGKLHIIFASQKKTDKQDAINLAKFIQRHPEDELPKVSLPSEEEMMMRRLVVEQKRIVGERT